MAIKLGVLSELLVACSEVVDVLDVYDACEVMNFAKRLRELGTIDTTNEETSHRWDDTQRLLKALIRVRRTMRALNDSEIGGG